MFRFESFRRAMLLGSGTLSAMALIMGCQGRPQAKNQAAAAKPSGTKELVTTGGATGGATSGAVVPQAVAGEQSPTGPLQIEKHDSKRLLRIQKDALKKEFLLSTSFLFGGTSPNWYYFMPRIVYFDQQGEKITLQQSNDTTIYNTVRADMLVETFPIVKQDEMTIVFDLGSGLTTFSYLPPSLNHKGEDMAFREAGRMLSDQLLQSAVTQVSQSGETIEIDEIGKILDYERASGKNDQSSSSEGIVRRFESTVTANFRIRPYRPNKEFQPRVVDSAQKISSISTVRTIPAYEKTVQKIAYRWDFRKGPVTVLIAAGFPSQYDSLVVESVDYWNRIFGGERLKIVRGANPQRPPPERTILVRWMPFEDKSTSWAVVQADPRTGELLNSQITITSSWAKLSALPTYDKNLAEGSTQSLSLIKALRICQIDMASSKMTTIPPQQANTLTRGNLRYAIAHEFGHALGLDHNFAGTYALETPVTEDILNLQRFYAGRGKAIMTTTTLMDYQNPGENGALGTFILDNILPYDQAAMRYLDTGDEKVLEGLKSTACSDFKLRNSPFKLYGCAAFDQGKNPILSAVLDGEIQKKKIVNQLFSHIVKKMYPADTNNIVPLDEVLNTMTSEALSTFIEDFVFGSISLLKNYLMFSNENRIHKELKTSSLLYSVVGKNDWTIENFASKKTEEVMGADLLEAGGLARILKILTPAAVTDQGLDFRFLEAQIQELVASPEFQSGVTFHGRVYSLTTAQQETIQKFLRLKTKAISDVMFEKLRYWSPGSKYNYSKLLKNDMWYPAVLDYMAQLMLANKSEKLNLKIGEKSFMLPIRVVPAELREDLADFFNRQYMNANVGQTASDELASTVSKLVNEIFTALYENESPGKAKPVPEDSNKMFSEVNRLQYANKITKEVADWMRGEISVLDRLGN